MNRAIPLTGTGAPLFTCAAQPYRDQRALHLNPSHLLSRLWYADCLARMQRYEHALEESDRALSLDPVSPLSYTNGAMLLFRAGRYDEAIRASQQSLEPDPHLPNALWWQGRSYACLRDSRGPSTLSPKAQA